ncbi:hypothetical protein [uncultured Agrobacterium sp.]|uniref:hypothetical protein n=1 Tax=uncultured Agrobacterium sp. TaxID=157277 RepID=UPI0025D122FE|nr:hypothetical protein [uncultured Agrobacterium sp.]
MHKNTSVADRASKIADLKIQDLGRRAIAERLGCSEKQARYALEYLRSQPVEEPPKPEKPRPARISSIAEISADIKPGKVHRFILTSAQDDTPVFTPFLDNLHAYAAHLNAPLLVGGFTYQKGLFEDHAAATSVFAPELRDYLIYDRVRLSDELLFVADANVLPTAANPLSGWQTTNGGRHVVVPHARVALESIPRMLDQKPRFAISTGCCTVPSYAPRAAGRKAIQHHTYGALLVEIDTDGEVFFGQLVGDERGSFQDLDALVFNGEVKSGYRVSTIAWGDIHHDQLDQAIAMASWGYDREKLRFLKTPNLLDRLKPFGSFLHDTLDFRWRNHHNIHDPISMSRMSARGTVSVEREVAEAVAFANGVRRPWCNTIVVESNHDSAIAKWLRGDEGRYDAENAHTWHRLNADWHDEVRAANDNFNVTEHAFRKFGLAPDVQFSPAGGSIVVSEVEHGLHGDLGIGGSRGSPLQYRRFGRRVTSAHTHSPRIADGSYVAGLSARLFQGYNIGPTTWAHAHVVLYPNGNRAMILMAADGRYRARGGGLNMP